MTHFEWTEAEYRAALARGRRRLDEATAEQLLAEIRLGYAAVPPPLDNVVDLAAWRRTHGK